MKERYKITPAVFVVVHDVRVTGEEVLLHKRVNTGFNDGFYDVASGHLERGELPPNGAARELSEEYGLTAKPEDLDLFHIVMNESDTPNEPYMYLFFRIARADCVGDYAIREPEKCNDLGMFPFNNLPKVAPYIENALRNLRTPAATFSRI